VKIGMNLLKKHACARRQTFGRSHQGADQEASMTRSFEKKLLGYVAVASTVAFTGSRATQGALITNSFTGILGTGGQLVDSSGNSFLSMGNDAVANVNGTGDPGVHLYVTNNKDKDSASYLTTGPTSTGALANILAGTVLGPSVALPSGTAWENNLSGTDNDIAYIDTVTGQQYVPTANAGATPYQFAIGTPGYFGFFFTPGSTTDYGYALINYDRFGHESVTYTYDDSGAAVTVPPTAVPEPASLSLLALGAVAMLRRTRKL
jgi:hypothetical protein